MFKSEPPKMVEDRQIEQQTAQFGQYMKLSLSLHVCIYILNLLRAWKFILFVSLIFICLDVYV